MSDTIKFEVRGLPAVQGNLTVSMRGRSLLATEARRASGAWCEVRT